MQVLVCMYWTRLVLVRPAASFYSASPLKHHATISRAAEPQNFNVFCLTRPRIEPPTSRTNDVMIYVIKCYSQVCVVIENHIHKNEIPQRENRFTTGAKDQRQVIMCLPSRRPSCLLILQQARISRFASTVYVYQYFPIWGQNTFCNIFDIITPSERGQHKIRAGGHYSSAIVQVHTKMVKLSPLKNISVLLKWVCTKKVISILCIFSVILSV